MNASLLTGLFEPIPDDVTGARGTWSWNPAQPVNLARLDQNSPTQEYSSKEDDED